MGTDIQQDVENTLSKGICCFFPRSFDLSLFREKGAKSYDTCINIGYCIVELFTSLFHFIPGLILPTDFMLSFLKTHNVSNIVLFLILKNNKSILLKIMNVTLLFFLNF